ncbi:DUF4160 domain-containing protein [Rhodoferax sp. UBA5149]
MPTVLRISGFRFHFYSDERMEPPHIHVELVMANANSGYHP